ncbi:unnamed protein product [Dibothriocephalus latus]|uniref:SEA domain-containing protein n=1 Tax=Dibothriocephalus latus TaxID=60516 RepID=A0A3P7LXI6_DIBLA|nr:unnamed protein product [Dibothriocephalus latus]
MRKLSVTVLLWLFACTISSEEFRVVELAVNVVEDATSPELTGGEGVVSATSESPPSIIEGIINDPPLDVTQEIVLQTTPAVEEPSLPTAGTTEANADDIIQTTTAADQVSEGGPSSLLSIPLLPLTTPTTGSSTPLSNSVEEEVVQEEALVDAKSDHLTTVSELTAPEQSETESSAALTETSVITSEDAITPEAVEVSTDEIDDSTPPPVGTITTSVHDAMVEVTPESGASSAETTTSYGPISLSEGTSVMPDLTTLSSTPEQLNVVTTPLEDSIPSTDLSDGPAPQVSFTTTPEALLPETVASFPPTEALTKQPDESTLLPYTPSEGDLSPATPATPMDASESASTQESMHSQSSTGASSPSFTTTTSEEPSPLLDSAMSPILEVKSSTAETSTEGLVEILTSTTETEAGSVVTSTFSPKTESILTDDIQQTPTQASYPPTSVQPPGTGSEISTSLTTESVASEESTFMEIGSSSQFPELSKSTTLTTTFKPNQKTTYKQEEHTSPTAKSTAAVSTATVTSEAVTTDSPLYSSIAELTTQTEPILLTTLPSPTTSSESYLPAYYSRSERFERYKATASNNTNSHSACKRYLTGYGQFIKSRFCVFYEDPGLLDIIYAIYSSYHSRRAKIHFHSTYSIYKHVPYFGANGGVHGWWNL